MRGMPGNRRQTSRSRTFARQAFSIWMLLALAGLRAPLAWCQQAPLAGTQASRLGDAATTGTSNAAVNASANAATHSGLKTIPLQNAPLRVHRFWDKENDWLFAGVGVSRGLDFASTANFRARGRQEILLTNGVVDNKPLFAGIEVAATGASIGASYLFHRTGHHRLERWVSFVHIGVTSFGVVRNYCLERAHPAPLGATGGTSE